MTEAPDPSAPASSDEPSAIDAAVAAEHPRREDEDAAQWQARLQPLQGARKMADVGRLPAPPKYTSADFLKPGQHDIDGERVQRHQHCGQRNEFRTPHRACARSGGL